MKFCRDQPAIWACTSRCDLSIWIYCMSKLSVPIHLRAPDPNSGTPASTSMQSAVSGQLKLQTAPASDELTGFLFPDSLPVKISCQTDRQFVLCVGVLRICCVGASQSSLEPMVRVTVGRWPHTCRLCDLQDSLLRNAHALQCLYHPRHPPLDFGLAVPSALAQ